MTQGGDKPDATSESAAMPTADPVIPPVVMPATPTVIPATDFGVRPPPHHPEFEVRGGNLPGLIQLIQSLGQPSEPIEGAEPK